MIAQRRTHPPVHLHGERKGLRAHILKRVVETGFQNRKDMVWRYAPRAKAKLHHGLTQGEHTERRDLGHLVSGSHTTQLRDHHIHGTILYEKEKGFYCLCLDGITC